MVVLLLDSWKSISSGKSALSVTATAKKNGYQYRCIVTDSAGNKVISNVVKLTVK